MGIIPGDMEYDLVHAREKWVYTLQWVRYNLVRQGDLDGSRRGVWSLTEQGRQKVAAANAEGRGAVPVYAPEQTPQTAATRPLSKAPLTRLLDLTLGWAEYVEQDEAEHPDQVKSDDLHALYQSVAQFAEPYWDATPDILEMAVRQFVDTRILPLLLRK